MLLKSYNHDHEIYGNYVYNCGPGVQLGGEEGGTIENVDIYNNILYSNTCGIRLHEMTGSPKRNVRIFNNTIVDFYGDWDGGINIWADNIENITIRNNICYTSYDGCLGQVVVNRSADLGEIDSADNLVYSPRWTGACGAWAQELYEGTTEADPLFVDKDNGDFHLQPAPPL